MNAASIQLGQLLVRAESEDNQGTELRPQVTTSITKRIKRWLEAGADPNSVICRYYIRDARWPKYLHRHVDVRSTDDFLEGLYNELYAQEATVQQKAQARRIVDPIRSIENADDELNQYITSLYAPFFDHAVRDSPGLMDAFQAAGASIDKVFGKVTAARLPHHLLANPFLNIGYPTLQHMLRLTVSSHPRIQRWLAQGLTSSLFNEDAESTILLLKHKAPKDEAKLPLTSNPWAVDFAVRNTKYATRPFSPEMQLRNQKAVSQIAPPTITVGILNQFSAKEIWDMSFDANERGFNGTTPLMLATGCRLTEACDIMIKRGAEINAYDIFGMTALTEAIHFGHGEAVRLLLARGADPNQAVDGKGRTSLASGDQSMTRIIWLAQRDVAATTYEEHRWSPIHLAARYGHTKIVQALIQAGANVATRDANNHSAIDIALQHSHDATALVLLHSGCPFQKTSSAASRLFDLAAAESQTGFVQGLFSAGADAYPQGLSDTRLCAECLFSLDARTSDSSVIVKSRDCKACQLDNECDSLGFDSTAIDGDTIILRQGSRYRQTGHSVKKLDDHWHSILRHVNSLEDENTGSPAAMSMASHWLKNCLINHRQCRRDSQPHTFPSRVLDIGDFSNGRRPRILQDSTIREPYVALSHRWGLEGLPSTTSENFAARLKGIDVAELSPTMRDAIHVVDCLGYRFIWIDALCIIQDSPNDWLSEASKMSSVFSGAVFTIAVADAVSHSQGIFRERSVRCLRPFHIPYQNNLPHRYRTRIEGDGECYVFPKNNAVGTGARTKGTLDTRGWILQEQLLSTRILYFDRGEIFWDCITLSASESSPLAASLFDEADPEETWALKFIRRTLGVTQDDVPHTRLADAWFGIIRNYSARDLTRASDRLIALQGIIQPLTRILDQKPLAGMWREQLWRQLLWWSRQPSQVGDDFPVPSWSWFSAKGRVYFHNSLPGENPPNETETHKFTNLRPFEAFRIDHIETEDLPGNIGVTGTMVVTAQSFPYCITSMDAKKAAHKRWHRAKLGLNTGRWMLDRQTDLPLDVQCIIVAQDTDAKLLVCLCVVEVDRQEGLWKRVGLCHWEGLAWQIPTYAKVRLELRKFTLV